MHNNISIFNKCINYKYTLLELVGYCLIITSLYFSSHFSAFSYAGKFPIGIETNNNVYINQLLYTNYYFFSPSCETNEPFHPDNFIFFDNLNAFISTYSDKLFKIESINLDPIFKFNDFAKFYYADGKILSNVNSTNHGSYFYNYNRNLINNSVMTLFPHSINYEFLDYLYGNDRIEIESSFELVNIFGKKRPFNKKNNASLNLKKAVIEIVELAKVDASVNQWIKKLHTISTYSPRSVAAMSRKSMHSYGIAIDFITKNKAQSRYWLWDSYFYPNWSDYRLSENKHNQTIIPNDIIGIMEKHGFVWGGKWDLYDIMHFEYRPEILNKRLY